MYDSTTTVAVGLDVHARSIRLAAVRADELLEERTLPYDEEAVERALRRWPGVCSRPRGTPTGRASPLDSLLHVRTRIEMKHGPRGHSEASS